MIKKSDFFFELADEQIAKYPLAKRDESKLLIHSMGQTDHSIFNAISNYIDDDTREWSRHRGTTIRTDASS
jgi:S-adenosylmethionine:tRNA ribosyltransferase-isomerase